MIAVVATAACIVGRGVVSGAVTSPLTLTIMFSTQIRLNWEDNLSNESGYKVQRKTDQGDFVDIATLPADTVSYTDNGVTSGKVYTYRVLWSDSTKTWRVYTDEVSTTTTSVVAPNSLTVTPVTSTRIDLSWTYPDSKGYETAIERRTSNGEWKHIATVGRGINNYSDEGLNPNTIYYYRIKAVSGTQVSSRTYPDNNVGIGAYALLKGPENLYGYAASETRIVLFWDDCENETSYVIERKTDGEDTFNVVGYIPANSTSWSDWGVTRDTRYIYRIKAVSGANSSAYSQEVAITSTYLDAPRNLTVSTTSGNEVTLSWDDNSGRETGFEIWRRDEKSDTWELIESTGRNVNSYTDSGISTGNRYYYRVRALISNRDVYSAFSNEATVKTIKVNAPSDLNYTVDSNLQVKLTWSDNSANETGFIIERKTGMKGSWAVVATLGEGKTSFTHTGLAKNVQYFYRVKAYNSIYNSGAYSEEIEVIIGDAPKAVSGFNIKAVSSTEVLLTWNDNSDDELGFEIERRIATSQLFRKIGEAGADETSFLDSGLKPGTRYCYRIRAYNKNGKSAYSRSVYVTTRQGEDFNDVSSGHWAYDAVQSVISRGIMEPLMKNYFDPEGSVTRGEFAAIMVKALKLDSAATGSFADVNPGTKYYKEIMVLKNLDIISGDVNNRYYPERALSRQDMGVIVSRAMKAVEKPLAGYKESVLNKYCDRDSIAPYALDSMASLVGEKIINDRKNDEKVCLEPTADVTRAEVAWVLYNILKKY